MAQSDLSAEYGICIVNRTDKRLYISMASFIATMSLSTILTPSIYGLVQGPKMMQFTFVEDRSNRPIRLAENATEWLVRQ